MQNRLTIIVAAIGVGGLVLVLPTRAYAQPFADAKKGLVDYTKANYMPRVSCDALTGMKFPDLVSLRARAVPAEGAVPAHCRVNGVIAPEVAFEVNLPAQWNGRFYMIGNGGHAGDSHDNPGRAAQRAEALQLGFAMAGTNTGHDAAKEPGASFALSNPQKAIDYAYRAVHVSAVAAKDLAKTYYARPVDHSYWNSCSNGGRQGLIEAQRFPDDFDGVVANAPWTDQTGFTIGAMWNQRAVTEAQLTPEKMAFVASRVMASCDAVDGLTDGLIDDPRACRFDPAKDVPACSAGTSTAECLTTAEAGALTRIYGGVTSNGKSFFPGFMPGSEAVVPGFGGGAPASGWVNMIVPRQADAKPADFNLAEGTMRYLVFDPPNPNYDYRTFDFDKDPPLLTRWGALANANNPDLSSFRKRGGKVLMTYGWADSILQPMMGVNYYERALEVNGTGTTDFFRLFMVPGMAHCGGGVGPDRHDPMTAIIDWVEKGKAPDTLLASKVVGDKVVRTRPLCAYPQVARYTGTGSIDDAANFRCVAPGR